MAPHCSILAGRIPWAEEPGGLWTLREEKQISEKHCSHTRVAIWKNRHLELYVIPYEEFQIVQKLST